MKTSFIVSIGLAGLVLWIEIFVILATQAPARPARIDGTCPGGPPAASMHTAG